MRKTMLIAIIGLFLFSIMGVSATAPQNTSVKNVIVTGITYNGNSYSLVPGANVTITCNGYSNSTTSDLNKGTYHLQISHSYCQAGDIITVTAVKGNLYGSASNPVKDYGMDVNLALIMVPMTPEFSFFLGTLTLISAVGIFFVVRKD